MNNIKEQNGIEFFKETTMEELEEKGFIKQKCIFKIWRQRSNRNYKLEK